MESFKALQGGFLPEIHSYMPLAKVMKKARTCVWE